ncbi:hypothetical protein BO71DRAFT_316290, partial [Aspergillus ellipticus CBS 707.79]
KLLLLTKLVLNSYIITTTGISLFFLIYRFYLSSFNLKKDRESLAEYLIKSLI